MTAVVLICIISIAGISYVLSGFIDELYGLYTKTFDEED